MPDKGTQYTVAILAGIGVLTLLYMINQQTGDATPVPEVQGEAQVMGHGVQAGMKVEAGSPLHNDFCLNHGYHPGYDPVPTAQPVTQSRHRYPALPGGNISTVMHKGWSSVMNDAPAGNDWRINPPEAAVL